MLMSMDLRVVDRVIFRPAYSLLPTMMDKPEANALMMAIGLQESRFTHRVQLIRNARHWWESLNGYARGWPQFEVIGVRGVLEHPASRMHALAILEALRYPEDARLIHKAIAHNDVLACCFARLLLWTDPRAFPALTHPPEAWWHYYIRNWRPGAPHRRTFDAFWYQAVHAVKQLNEEASK